MFIGILVLKTDDRETEGKTRVREVVRNCGDSFSACSVVHCLDCVVTCDCLETGPAQLIILSDGFHDDHTVSRLLSLCHLSPTGIGIGKIGACHPTMFGRPAVCFTRKRLFR